MDSFGNCGANLWFFVEYRQCGCNGQSLRKTISAYYKPNGRYEVSGLIRYNLVLGFIRRSAY